MDRLILFRHGKAVADAESGDDFDRRLAPRGVRESAEMAQRLAGLGYAPDLALVSPALRTRGTWEAAEPAFPGVEARFPPELYLADPSVLRRAAMVAGARARTLMLVAHNPGLQDLTARMLVEGGADATLLAGARQKFPTATAAVFRMAPDERPICEGLFYPERGA
jgi:phosphohistidine phosphatase